MLCRLSTTRGFWQSGLWLQGFKIFNPYLQPLLLLSPDASNILRKSPFCLLQNLVLDKIEYLYTIIHIYKFWMEVDGNVKIQQKNQYADSHQF